jgi:hypothetical protein
MNKECGPRVPPRAKMRIYRIPVSMDLARVLCSGRLRQRTPLDVSCLEFAGSDGIRSGVTVFLSDCLILEGALQSSAGYYHHTTQFLVPW